MSGIYCTSPVMAIGGNKIYTVEGYQISNGIKYAVATYRRGNKVIEETDMCVRKILMCVYEGGLPC